MTTDEILFGVGLLVALAVGSQILATVLRIPALIVLLPVGFTAGALTGDINPYRLLGPAFGPLVSLAVALILYDAGLGLDLRRLTGHPRRVVNRLVTVGAALTWAVAGFFASLLLGMSAEAAVMLGAILVVSGPTVVAPLLDFVRPTERLRQVLYWEGSMVDPIGGILGAVVFHAIVSGVEVGHGAEIGQFLLSVGVGVAGGVAGALLLWLLLIRMELPDTLFATAQLATVVAVAAGCDILREDTGLIAGIVMGLAVANCPGSTIPARRPFGETLVQLILGLLFISISATVTPQSLRHLVLPTMGLVAVLVLIGRPLVATVCTLGTALSTRERAFIGWMAPRGIVAASTASTFSATLVAQGIGGASRILPATFLVIVATVTLYGLTAVPVARWLGAARRIRTRTLLIGGELWVLDLAVALRSAGAEVVMWANLADERERIRAAGFDLLPGELLAAATGEGAQIEGLTMALVLTADDNFNALASSVLRGSTKAPVLRLAPPADSVGIAAHRRPDEMTFGPDLPGAAVVRRWRHGDRVVLGSAGEGVPPGSHLLFVVRPDGRLVPTTGAGQPALQAGDTLVLLGAPGPARPGPS